MNNIYNEIIKEIEKFNKIIITTHVRADGDCVGCAIGLKEIIKETYKDKIVLASYEYLDFIPYLPKCDKIEDEDFSDDALVISVDNSSISRANDLRISQAKNIIKIDHHPNNDPFGYINFVEEEKCACAEMIFDLYNSSDDLKISELGITALYTGIMTDSGRLKYTGVTGDTYRKVGQMVDMGVDRDMINDALDAISMTELKFKGFIFDHLNTTANGVLYVKVSAKDREKYGIEYNEASNMVNELANVEGYPIWVLFNEYKADEIRCRVRSSHITINDVCESFGGGGHANASGIVINDPKLINKIVEALDNRLKELK